MSWQRTARLGIAAFVVVFAVIVFLALRRSRPPVEATTSPRTDTEAVVQTRRGLDYRRTRDGKVLFTVSADEQLTYADGRTKLGGHPAITLPDRNGRTVKISGDELELEAPPDKTAELRKAIFRRNVRIEASDGLVVTANEATYDEGERMLRAPGEVQFTRGRMTGRGVGATYDLGREVLWLLAHAHVTVSPDEKGQGAAEATADAAGLARAEHFTRLSGHARIVGEGRTLDANEITIRTTPDDRLIQTIELRGSSRITGEGSGAALQHMAANDIDLGYGADGRSLERARLMENASVRLPGTAPGAGKTIAARTIDVGMAPDGATVTSLNASTGVVVELPAEGTAPAQRIEAAALTATGAAGAGLQNATFTGKVSYRETRPASRGAAAVERTARSERLMIETNPGLGAVQQADFRGNVRIVDGNTTADAPRALYRVSQDAIDLSPSSGDPGPEPQVNDGRVSVKARTLTMSLTSRKLTAETDVRSSLQGGRKAAGQADATKVPSMLEQDEPVLVTSNRLEYDGAASTALYTGSARLWQGQTSIEGDAIELDDRTGNLTAKGKVKTVMFLEDTDPKSKTKKLERTTATAAVLVYDEAKHLAVYTGAADAQAHIVGPQGDVIGDRIQLFLKATARELERAEADGHVAVEEGQRRAKGEHLTYTAADDQYVMTGKPVEVDEHTPPQCRKTRGATLTFRRSVDSVVVDGIPNVLPMVATPYACSGERRD